MSIQPTETPTALQTVLYLARNDINEVQYFFFHKVPTLKVRYCTRAGCITRSVTRPELLWRRGVLHVCSRPAEVDSQGSKLEGKFSSIPHPEIMFE